MFAIDWLLKPLQEDDEPDTVLPMSFWDSVKEMKTKVCPQVIMTQLRGKVQSCDMMFHIYIPYILYILHDSQARR